MPKCIADSRKRLKFLFVFCAVFGYILLTLMPLEGEPELMIHRPTNLVPLDGVWQKVSGTLSRFYVYSAYVERRTVAAVRVIAATKRIDADAVVCRLWLTDNRTLTLEAKVQAIREHWELKYSAAYVLCLLRGTGVKPQDTVGASLAIIASYALRRPTTNLLLVMNTEQKKGVANTLHVCVKPFHFSYDRDEWIVEWIEMNRLLGVSHFYMYNNSMSDKMGCVLNHYQRQGLITLLPWKLPILSLVEIRIEGQFAAFNDCLYRSMANAAWLMPIDTDEVVLPRRERTLPSLLTGLMTTLTSNYTWPSKVPSAFLFRNAFFYLRWDDDPKAPVSLLTSRKTRRLTTPDAENFRSKYVVRPRKVIELGNHFVWQHVSGGYTAGVPVEIGLLHHYRVNCAFRGCLKMPSTMDRTAHRWAKDLWHRVQAEQKQIQLVCA